MSDPRLPADDGEIDLGEIDENEPQDPEENGDDPAEADGGSDGGEADDAEGEGEEGQPRDIGRRSGGGAQTPRNLRQQLREERQARARLEQQIAQITERLNQPAAPDPAAAQRAAEARRERRELMTPQELADDIAAELRSEFQQTMLRSQLAIADASDRREYAALRERLPAAGRLEREVERLLTAERQAGNYRFTRQDILRYLVGQEVLEKRTQAIPGQRRDGQRRIAGQTTQTGRARGDVARTGRGGGDQDAADEALLRGITLADL